MANDFSGLGLSAKVTDAVAAAGYTKPTDIQPSFAVGTGPTLTSSPRKMKASLDTHWMVELVPYLVRNRRS